MKERKIDRVKQRKIFKFILDRLFYHNGYLPECGNCQKGDLVPKNLEVYNTITAKDIVEKIIEIYEKK